MASWCGRLTVNVAPGKPLVEQRSEQEGKRKRLRRGLSSMSRWLSTGAGEAAAFQAVDSPGPHFW